jgi:hypothetical protein
MRSSISASEDRTILHQHRVIPRQPWPRLFVLTLLLEVACIVSWELFWRAHYFVPDDYEDTPAVWQIQRERATGNATVLIGSSRMWQDVDLTAWQAVTGTRPIQLAVAGKNPRPVLHDLADDRDFRGLVLCEVTPFLFFVESEVPILDFMRRGRAQTLSQRAANRLSMALERWLAFIDNETRISTLWTRIPLPLRPGAFPVREVPKGHLMSPDRNARMWTRLEKDPGYLAQFQRLWLFFAGGPQRPLADDPPSAATAFPGLVGIVDSVATEVAADVRRIRARGGDVVFIRFPSSGPVYASESRAFPRALAWEPFLAQTHTTGVHFADYPQLQGYRLPEWSHMAAEDAPRFTRELAAIASGLTLRKH